MCSTCLVWLCGNIPDKTKPAQQLPQANDPKQAVLANRAAQVTSGCWQCSKTARKQGNLSCVWSNHANSQCCQVSQARNSAAQQPRQPPTNESCRPAQTKACTPVQVQRAAFRVGLESNHRCDGCTLPGKHMTSVDAADCRPTSCCLSSAIRQAPQSSCTTTAGREEQQLQQQARMLL